MAKSRRYLANAIRALSMDAVEKANSGHPGMPLGMADIAEVLWNDYLKHSPNNPDWINRDRFVVSNGHGSMLLYSLLHLSGYSVSIDDLKHFRQLDSTTPGHPEYGETPGVETTTGPLGQGLANAVGMAIAERVLAAQFNKENHEIIDHFTYVFVGDGCLMEGISHEACSLAGTLGLGKLIVFYDDNNISIDGEVNNWFSDDTPQRFRSYGWHVVPEVDGHNARQIKAAIEEAQDNSESPTLICCKTKIGWGSPNQQGKETCHGAPLGKDEIELTRENIAWTHPPFEVPKEIYQGWNVEEKGKVAEELWNAEYNHYKNSHPKLAAELERRLKGKLPDNWSSDIQNHINKSNSDAENIASRKASQKTLSVCAKILPELIGGSADLASSNLTLTPDTKPISHEDYAGNYIYFGVREFAMSAITNGIALHGGFLVFCATFLMFSEYARNALRMSALMKIPNTFLFTHDSVALGEDGPTHQPVEQTATLRLIPNMSVWRPADEIETTIAWKSAIERTTGPTSLILSRQNLSHINRTTQQLNDISRGGYVLRDCASRPQLIIIATGSEVSFAIAAWEILASDLLSVRVVSMPSTDVFDMQDDKYKNSVLPNDVDNVIAVEAGVSDGWQKYVGRKGKVIGINSFGKSAPGEELLHYFGITTENIVNTAKSYLELQPAHAHAKDVLLQTA